MTLKHAQQIARRCGISIRKTSAGDYRINFRGDPEKYAVYENTVQDAYDTSMYMYNEKVKRG
jgi:hypothetical protein